MLKISNTYYSKISGYDIFGQISNSIPKLEKLCTWVRPILRTILIEILVFKRKLRMSNGLGLFYVLY